MSDLGLGWTQLGVGFTLCATRMIATLWRDPPLSRATSPCPPNSSNRFRGAHRSYLRDESEASQTGSRPFRHRAPREIG